MPVEVKYMYPSVRVESHMNSVPTNKTYNYDDKNPTFIGNGVANAFSGYHASNTNVTNKPRASRDQVWFKSDSINIRTPTYLGC